MILRNALLCFWGEICCSTDRLLEDCAMGSAISRNTLWFWGEFCCYCRLVCCRIVLSGLQSWTGTCEMRQNLAEEREIDRDRASVSLIAHLLKATIATDVSVIESPLHRHAPKTDAFCGSSAGTNTDGKHTQLCSQRKDMHQKYRYRCLTVITIKTVCKKTSQHIDHIHQFGWQNAQTSDPKRNRFG